MLARLVTGVAVENSTAVDSIILVDGGGWLVTVRVAVLQYDVIVAAGRSWGFVSVTVDSTAVFVSISTGLTVGGGGQRLDCVSAGSRRQGGMALAACRWSTCGAHDNGGSCLPRVQPLILRY